MANMNAQIDHFFNEYAARTNHALANPPVVDVNAATAAFAPYFVEASPKGVNGGANDDEFRKAIPKGFAFYRSIGTQSMKITDKTVTPLDDFHWMVKVHWQAAYEKEGKKDVINFDVIYFLNGTDNDLKIFAYITGDEEQTYKDHGLVPAEAAAS